MPGTAPVPLGLEGGTRLVPLPGLGTGLGTVTVGTVIVGTVIVKADRAWPPPPPEG